MAHIITANRLDTGEIVYFTKDGTWSAAFSDGLVLEGGDSLQTALEAAKRDAEADIVVDVYELAVTVDDSGVSPNRTREKIRANGPSIPLPNELTHVA